MTTSATGETHCDRCGADLGNGGIDKCAVVTDLHPGDGARLVNLHLGRDCGCAGRVLTKAALRHFHDNYQPPAQVPPDAVTSSEPPQRRKAK